MSRRRRRRRRRVELVRTLRDSGCREGESRLLCPTLFRREYGVNRIVAGVAEGSIIGEEKGRIRFDLPSGGLV